MKSRMYSHVWQVKGRSVRTFRGPFDNRVVMNDGVMKWAKPTRLANERRAVIEINEGWLWRASRWNARSPGLLGTLRNGIVFKDSVGWSLQWLTSQYKRRNYIQIGSDQWLNIVNIGRNMGRDVSVLSIRVVLTYSWVRNRHFWG